jgi:hypothetical protein
MIKISDIREFLGHVSTTLRTVAEERDGHLTKIASLEMELGKYKYRDRVEKVAQRLEGKGHFAGMGERERLEYVEKAAAKGTNLDVLQEAADMITRDGSLGTLAKEKAAGNAKAGFVASILEES